jgi:hypothetical protein
MMSGKVSDLAPSLRCRQAQPVGRWPRPGLAKQSSLGLHVHGEFAAMICQRCGAMMRLLNRGRARLQLYWCPACQRFQEMRRD